MQRNPAIHKELSDLNSLLAEISTKNVFTVPDDYFQSLNTDLIPLVRNNSLITQLDKEYPGMTIPPGYFDGLASSVIDKIKAETKAEGVSFRDSSIINTISRHNIFSVPDNYFDSLANDILVRVSRPAKVMKIYGQSFFKYALAAAITGILGFSLFSTLNKTDGMETTVSSSLAVLAKVDYNEKNKNFDSEFASLDDDEIVGYLQNNGDDINAALVASVTDEQALPNEDAYYTDDKTLENFLGDLDVTTGNN